MKLLDDNIGWFRKKIDFNMTIINALKAECKKT